MRFPEHLMKSAYKGSGNFLPNQCNYIGQRICGNGLDHLQLPDRERSQDFAIQSLAYPDVALLFSKRGYEKMNFVEEN